MGLEDFGAAGSVVLGGERFKFETPRLLSLFVSGSVRVDPGIAWLVGVDFLLSLANLTRQVLRLFEVAVIKFAVG